MGNEKLTFNHDGSVDLDVDGNKVRYVKESDLVAVKEGSKSKVEQLDNERSGYQSQLAEANWLRDETNQLLLQERAAKEQLVTKYNDYDTFKTKVGELEKTVESHKARAEQYEKEVASRMRHSLIMNHGASEDGLKDKTLDQLRNLEEAALLFGNKGGKPARYDGGPGGRLKWPRVLGGKSKKDY